MYIFQFCKVLQFPGRGSEPITNRFFFSKWGQGPCLIIPYLRTRRLPLAGSRMCHAWLRWTVDLQINNWRYYTLIALVFASGARNSNSCVANALFMSTVINHCTFCWISFPCRYFYSPLTRKHVLQFPTMDPTCTKDFVHFTVHLNIISLLREKINSLDSFFSYHGCWYSYLATCYKKSRIIYYSLHYKLRTYELKSNYTSNYM